MFQFPPNRHQFAGYPSDDDSSDSDSDDDFGFLAGLMFFRAMMDDEPPRQSKKSTKAKPSKGKKKPDHNNNEKSKVDYDEMSFRYLFKKIKNRVQQSSYEAEYAEHLMEYELFKYDIMSRICVVPRQPVRAPPKKTNKKKSKKSRK